MRFHLRWFSPFRNPLRLLREVKESIIWLNDLEDHNPEYKKYSNQGSSGLIGMMMQFLLFAIIYTIGVSFFD